MNSSTSAFKYYCFNVTNQSFYGCNVDEESSAWSSVVTSAWNRLSFNTVMNNITLVIATFGVVVALCWYLYSPLERLWQSRSRCLCLPCVRCLDTLFCAWPKRCFAFVKSKGKPTDTQTKQETVRILKPKKVRKNGKQKRTRTEKDKPFIKQVHDNWPKTPSDETKAVDRVVEVLSDPPRPPVATEKQDEQKQEQKQKQEPEMVGLGKGAFLNSDDCWQDAQLNIQFAQPVVVLFCVWEFLIIQSIFADYVFTNFPWVSVTFACGAAALGMVYIQKLGTIVSLLLSLVFAFAVMVMISSTSYIWAVVLAVALVIVAVLMYVAWNYIKLEVGVWLTSVICASVLVYCTRFIIQTCDIIEHPFATCMSSTKFQGMAELNDDLINNFRHLCEGVESCQSRLMWVFTLVIARVVIVRAFDPFRKEHPCYGYKDSERLIPQEQKTDIEVK